MASGQLTQVKLQTQPRLVPPDALNLSPAHDEPWSVAAPPSPGVPGPPSGGLGEGDINRSDWAAAQKRHALRAGSDADEPPVPTVDLSERTGGTAATSTSSRRHTRYARFTRGWALVKLAISVTSMWLTLVYLKAKPSEYLCFYGLLCFWWAAGPLWRKRCFGPGQQLEPELYEAVTAWLWRAGTVLVLAAGALYFL